MKTIRRFIHRVLTVCVHLVQPESFREQQDERSRECNFWFEMAQVEHRSWWAAVQRDDRQAMHSHHERFLLLKRRFEMAKDGHFTKG